MTQEISESCIDAHAQPPILLPMKPTLLHALFPTLLLSLLLSAGCKKDKEADAEEDDGKQSTPPQAVVVLEEWDRVVVVLEEWDRVVVVLEEWNRVVVVLEEWNRVVVVLEEWDRVEANNL
jgi:hypothetical protein